MNNGFYFLEQILRISAQSSLTRLVAGWLQFFFGIILDLLPFLSDTLDSFIPASVASVFGVGFSLALNECDYYA